MPQKKWPNFFVVGAPRSGTTSLYENLKKIPEIFLPEIKEPNYFSVSVDPKYYRQPIRDEEKYLDLFDNAGTRIAGETSPSYLRDPKTPQLIYDVAPKSLIIICLRDPIERALSHYLLMKGMGTVSISFHELVSNCNSPKDEYSKRILESGLYCNQVKRYLEIFGKKQVKIIIFEHFIKEPKKYFRDLLEFLNLQSTLPDSIERGGAFTSFKSPAITPVLKNSLIRKLGKKIPPRWARFIVKQLVDSSAEKPKIPNEDLKELQKYYCNDVSNLEKILEQNLPWNTTKVS